MANKVSNSKAIEYEGRFYDFLVDAYAKEGRPITFEFVAVCMATAAQETQSFRHFKERSYTLSRAKQVWPARFRTNRAKDLLAKYGNAAIFEIAYGERLGNDVIGDAVRYIGRGIIHITGKENYRNAAKATGLDIVNNPELAEDFDNACIIFKHYFDTRVNREAAMEGDVLRVTKDVNGGTNGLAARRKHYAFYLKYARDIYDKYMEKQS